MSQRIITLELALQQISEAKRQLYRNTTEAKLRIQCNISQQLEELRNCKAKSRIQCNISRQLEALRNREVWLLNQLDVISGAKEEVLQQQSARLHKTLGVLQTARGNDHDDLQQFTRLEFEDIQPEETPHVSFRADATTLRDAILTYGKIDASTVPGVQSPYTAPEQPAPSLPRHFEDYNDAEHHVLYKTLEEVSRNKAEKPCVYVNIPKLSNKMEDWLLLPKAPASTTSTSAEPHYTFPKLSNNLADWLKAPISLCNKAGGAAGTPGGCGGGDGASRPLVDGISADASIQTWLHKIKQNPYEEDEDDFEFIEEMSDTRTATSEDLLEPPAALRYGIDQDMWLYQQDKTLEQPNMMDMKVPELPMDQWLLRSTTAASDPQTMVSLSHLLTAVTDELDKWLLARAPPATDARTEAWVNLATSQSQTKPAVPSSLRLPHTTAAGLTDNPWLLRSRASSVRSSSPASSRSSQCGASRSCPYNKWLLNGGQSDAPDTSYIPCPLMDSYKKNIANTVWIQSANMAPQSQSRNPLANFSGNNTDMSTWLKPVAGFSKISSISDFVEKSPLKSFLDFYKSASVDDWLAQPGDVDQVEEADKSDKPTVDALLSMGLEDKRWLHTCSSASSLPLFDDDVTEEDL